VGVGAAPRHRTQTLTALGRRFRRMNIVNSALRVRSVDIYTAVYEQNILINKGMMT